MNRYNKLISDTVLMAIGNFSSRVLIFLLLPFYTYILTTEDYGIADMFTTTITLLIPILTLSISEATFRFSFDKDIDQASNIFCSVLIVVLSAVVLLPITLGLSAWNTNFAEYGIYFILLYLTNALYTCFINYARGTNHIRVYVFSSVIHTILLIVFNILFLVVAKIGIRGYLLSMVLAFGGGALYVFVRIKCWNAFLKNNFDAKLCKNMLRFSIPMIFAVTSWWIMNSISKYMIIDFFGIDESGIYGVAQKIPTIISVLSSIFIQAWQVSAIDAHGEQDTSAFYTNVYKIYETGLFVAATCLILVTKPLATLLFQRDYFEAYVYVPILVLSCVFSCLSSFMQGIFVAKKKSGVLLSSTLVGAVVSIVSSYLLLTFVGTMGAAYATLFGFIVAWVVRMVISRKFVDMNLNWFKTIFSMLLLLVESIIISNDFQYGMLFSGIIVIFIMLLHFSEILTVFNGIVNMIRRRIQICSKGKRY